MTQQVKIFGLSGRGGPNLELRWPSMLSTSETRNQYSVQRRHVTC